MHCFTTEDVGRTRSLTPQGYMVCSGAVIARTGNLYYMPGEIIPGDGETAPVAGPNGVITVSRDADELFHPDTLASFEGQPITVGHPADENGMSVWVSPENWNYFSCGFLRNVRRGEGAQSDLMLADLFVTSPTLIDKIDSGELRELSNGYDCNYPQSGPPGTYKQTAIRGNHVAFVPRGRNGSRCAVGDAMHPLLERPDMTTASDRREPAAPRRPMAVTSGRRTTMDRFRTALRSSMRTRDEDGMEAATEEVVERLQDVIEEAVQEAVEVVQSAAPDASEVTIDEAAAPTIDPAIQAQLDAINATLATLMERLPASPTTDEAMPDKGDDKEAGVSKTTDAAIAQDIVARAEILAPGIRVPTLDSAASAVEINGRLHGLRIAALDTAYKTEVGKTAIDSMLGGRPASFAGMTTDAVDMIFRGASEVMKSRNNRDRGERRTQPATDAEPITPASLNKSSKAFWATR